MDGRQSMSRKRKAPIADPSPPPKKRPRKKTTGTRATVDSPAPSVPSLLPSSSLARSQRQRRPSQRNASPGPSRQIPSRTQTKSSASVSSSKKRVRTPSSSESDGDPPLVPTLKSGRVPKLSAKRLASAALSKKAQKTSSKRQKTTPIASTEVIELLSSSEDEDQPPPVSKCKPPPLPAQHRKLVMESSDVIDLCSDDDECTPKSSPVRTRLEKGVTEILSSDEETRPSASEAKSGRSARLKKLTLKAQALLDEKGIAKSSLNIFRSPHETQALLPPPRLAEERARSAKTKAKPPRRTATSPSNVTSEPAEPTKSKPPTPPPQNAEDPASEIDDLTPLPSDNKEDVADAEATELQQAIYDSFVQEYSAVSDAAPPELAVGDGDTQGLDGDGQAGVVHGDGVEATQEESQSRLTPSLTLTLALERPSTPPTPLHPTGPPDPLSESNAHVESPSPLIPISISDPESQTVLDILETENDDPALQDAILLSLILKEGGMENDVPNAVVHPTEEPANDPIARSAESQEPVSTRDGHVENSSTRAPVHSTIPSVVAECGNETQDVRSTQLATSEVEPPIPAIPLRSCTPLLRGDVGDGHEDTELQDVLLTSFEQQETVSEDKLTDPVIPIPEDLPSSGHGFVQPASYSQTVDPDDMTSYLPLHLSYAPQPPLDPYDDQGNDHGVIQELLERDAALASGAMADPVLASVAGDSEYGSSEPGAETVSQTIGCSIFLPAEPQVSDECEPEAVKMQRALLEPLVLNEGNKEEHAADENKVEEETTELNGKEHNTISNPNITFSKYTSMPNTPAQEVALEAPKVSPKPPSPELLPCDTIPDRPSISLNSPFSSPDRYTAVSCSATKSNFPITYTSCPPTAFPQLLTHRFFAQSFLQPSSQSLKALMTLPPTVAEGPSPQSGPQSSEPLQECPPPLPASRHLQQHDDHEDNPEETDGSDVIQASLETNLPSEAPVVAQSPPVICGETSSEEAEEAEVDVELTHSEALEDSPMIAAAVTEANLLMEMLKDAQQCATGSPGGDRASPERTHPSEQPKAESGPCQVCLDGSDTQQSGERGHSGTPEARCPSSEQPKPPGKSLSESSLDSSGTIEDSPAPTTPPLELGCLDPSSFFIRSSSPIDFDFDILKNFVDTSAPPLPDKDDDAYLLSTHSFDYPDDVDVVG